MSVNDEGAPDLPDGKDGEQVASEPPAVVPEFLIVGVGASAGGLEAFTQLIGALPADPDLAILYVQHIEPQRESMLAQILGRAASMPVHQAEDGMPVLKNHVYVIPPNKVMLYRKGRLVLGAREREPTPFMPFDHLCRSLADELGNRAVGVVLSGTGTDGTLGLAAIKTNSGVTLVQDSSAQHQEMPRSVVLDGHADFIYPPAEIARQLLRLVRNTAVLTSEPQAEIPGDGEGLATVMRILRSLTGVDFSLYKHNTVKRRIQRRIVLHNLDSFDAYLDLLQKDPSAVQALYNDLLIRVTNFFRDPEAFEALKATVFPRLFRDRPSRTPVRIWVAGCATGEEVYSVAISLLEYLGDQALSTPIKILATDVNEAAIEKARQGTYIENIELDVSAERLRRFFTKTNSHYQIAKSIRDLCVFSRHNLFSDPPFSRLDLICCRNVLIYLSAALQRRIIPLFHYALKPGGMLMLGMSESVGTFTDLFASLHDKHHIYARRAVPSGVSFDLGMAQSAAEGGFGANHHVKRELSIGQDLQREADRLVLNRYAPAGVVVDENLNVLQFRGRTGAYLEPAPGAATLNLLSMLREGLMVEVRTAFLQAKLENSAVRRQGLLIRDGAAVRRISIEVLPLRAASSDQRYFLVLFQETPANADPPSPTEVPAKSPPSEAEAEFLQKRTEQLQQELVSSRDYLQALSEEYEATNEELKSANEEILSSNEELQSTNEELQTAKEETQSTNAELATLNEELQSRNVQLGKLNDDLVNLLAGVNIPIIMVGMDLRIRRFTPQAEKILNLIPTDIGRPLSDIRPNINFDELETTIHEVIRAFSPREVEVRDRDGRWYTLCIRPYITQDNRIDGATITAFDIDSLRRSMEQLRQSRDYADGIIETVWEPLVVLDAQLVMLRANRAFYEVFHTTPQEVLDRSFLELNWRQLNLPKLKTFLKTLPPQTPRGADFELEVDLPNLGRRWLVLKAHRLAKDGGEQRILLAVQDVTERKREVQQARLLAEEQSARAQAELASRLKDEFLAMLAHELRNPLMPIRNSLVTLRNRLTKQPECLQILDRIDRQSANMTRLLDDLLDVARITQRKIQLHREPVDVAVAVNQVVDALRASAATRRQELQVMLPDQPLTVNADPVRLDQILTNLLNNAIKYTPAGGHIAVTALRDGDTLVLSVKDDGFGIPPEMLTRIFDLFVQSGRSLDRAQGGLGIGLSLVKSLVEMHGGLVEVHSAGPGQGSEFIIRLPLSVGEAPHAERAAASPAPEGHGLPVLIVDDNPEIADSLAQLLQDMGYRVTVAYSGPEALTAVRTSRPRAVLLDLGLPGMDGFEVARRLRKEFSKDGMLLVAVSGYGSDEDRQRSQEAGFDYHLVKPVGINDLGRILAKAVEH